MRPLSPHGAFGTAGAYTAAKHAMLFLCSPEASFPTGAAVPVDGGYVARSARDQSLGRGARRPARPTRLPSESRKKAISSASPAGPNWPSTSTWMT